MSGGGNFIGSIKRNYDKLLLVLFGLLLAASAVMLGLKAKKVDNVRLAHNKTAAAKAVDLDALNARLKMAKKPFQATSFEDNPLLSSMIRVSCPYCDKPIPADAKICVFCKKEQPGELYDFDDDGVPDKFEKEVGMDSEDSNDGLEDMDGDGFTNLEEYDAEAQAWRTDPRDPESKPPATSKLRLFKYRETPFKMKFNGVSELQNGTKVYQLNMGTKTYMAFADQPLKVRVGGGKPDEVYEIVSFEPESATNEAAVLTLGREGKEFRLIKDRPLNKKDKKALVVSLLDKRRITAVIDGSFNLEGVKYNIVDMDRSKVVIQKADSDEKIVVGKITAEEEDILMGRVTPGGSPRGALGGGFGGMPGGG